MANGDTTNRTTNTKLNKNDVNHLNTNANRVNAAAASENKTGGRIRRRSAPPVTIEGMIFDREILI